MSAQIVTLPTARATNIIPFPSRAPDVDVFVAGAPVTDNHNRQTAGAISAKRGRVHYQSDATLAWRGAVMAAVHNAIVRLRRRLSPPVTVVCIFINCTGDAANYLKTTSDGIEDATGINDRHYHPITADRQRHKGHAKGAIIQLWGHDGPKGTA